MALNHASVPTKEWIILGWTQEFGLSIWSHTQKSAYPIMIWKLMII